MLTQPPKTIIHTERTIESINPDNTKRNENTLNIFFYLFSILDARVSLTPQTNMSVTEKNQPTKQQTTYQTTKKNKNGSAVFGRPAMKLLGGRADGLVYTV